MHNTNAFTRILPPIRRCLALLLACLALAACAPQTPQEVSSIFNTTPEPVLKTVYEGDLLLPVDGDLNPVIDLSPWNQSLFRLIYDSPVQLDDAGKPAPALTTAWSTTDGLVWRFTLRSGVSFHDGMALTAQDIVRSYETLRYGDAYKAMLSPIASMQADDDATITVTAKQAGYSLLYAMTFPVLGREEHEALPVGTGPWRVESRAQGVEWVLTRNASWYRKQPVIDTIRAYPASSEDEALGMLAQGNLSLAPIFQALSPTAVSGAGARHIAITTRQYEFLAPNFSSAILSRPEVREAIAYALDVPTLIAQRLEGQALEAETPVIPGSWLSNPAAHVYHYQPEKAQQALVLAGWTLGSDGVYMLHRNAEDYDALRPQTLTFRLLVNLDRITPTRRDTARLISDMLAKAGMRVELVELEWDAYQTALINGDFDLALAGITIDRAGDLTPLLGSNGERNIMRFADAELDTLLAQCQAATDEAAIVQAYAAMQTATARKLPIIGLYFRAGVLAYAPELTGIAISTQDALYYRADAWMFIK